MPLACMKQCSKLLSQSYGFDHSSCRDGTPVKLLLLGSHTRTLGVREVVAFVGMQRETQAALILQQQAWSGSLHHHRSATAPYAYWMWPHLPQMIAHEVWVL
jgi:hypothetical protein